MQTVRNETNLVISEQKPQQSLMCRSLSSATSMILRSLVQGSDRHTSLSALLNEFNQNGDTMIYTNIDEQSNQMLAEIREWMKFINYGFIQLTTEKRQYVKYQNSNIFKYLVDAQDNLSYGKFREGFLRELLAMREKLGWTEEFVKEWIQKSVEMKENKIQLFSSKKSTQSNTSKTQKKTLKRAAPSFSKNSSQIQTQIGEQPTKKIKKDTINYRAIIVSVQSIIKHVSSDEQKSQVQTHLKNFKSTQNPQYLQSLDKASLKQMLEVRAYMKSFMEAYIEIIQKEEYRKYDDGEMIHRLMRAQEGIHPENVLEGYKKLLNENYFGNGLPEEMISEMIQKIIEKKNIQTQIMLQRLRQRQRQY